MLSVDTSRITLTETEFEGTFFDVRQHPASAHVINAVREGKVISLNVPPGRGTEAATVSTVELFGGRYQPHAFNLPYIGTEAELEVQLGYVLNSHWQGAPQKVLIFHDADKVDFFDAKLDELRSDPRVAAIILINLV